MTNNFKENWEKHSQMVIDHWGAVSIEPTEADLADEASFKNFLMKAYGWDGARAAEEIKWFSDFTRTFESK